MSQKLTLRQKAILVRASNSVYACADNIGWLTGMALQNKGYGYYRLDNRTFYLNNAGLRFGLYGEQV